MPVPTSTSFFGSSRGGSSAPKDAFGFLPASEPIHAVALNPFEWAASLVAFGGRKSIVVGEIKLGEEGESEKAVEFNRLSEFHHDGRVEVIAWSPESSLLTYPKVASTGDDLTARVWTLKNPSSSLGVGGGDPVASRGDPATSRNDSEMTPEMSAFFPLGSPGVALGWHPDDPAKLMVAERSGVIRFYNVSNQQTILSLDTNCSVGLLDRLSCADLCPGNPLLVGGVVSNTGQRLVWDISRSSQPQTAESTSGHPEGGGICAFSVAKPHLLASVGKTGGQIRVLNIQTSATVFSTSHAASRGLSWHARLPLLAVGGDKQVVLWKVEG